LSSSILFFAVHTLAFVAGLALVIATIESTINTLIVPRAISSHFARWLYMNMLGLFKLRLSLVKNLTYERRDRIMVMYAPLTLFVLPFVWLTQVMLGYTLMFWGLRHGSLWESFLVSGSSLLTLGTIVFPEGRPWITLLMFSEAMMGMVLVALLIAYLPTIYSAFSEREKAVIKLATPAGTPPSPITMLIRLWRVGDEEFEETLHTIWLDWRDWFTGIDESHTSFAALVFFRSSKSAQSWITSAGVVLDAAALTNSALDIPHDVRADLCIRSGYVALRDIADFFRVDYQQDPEPTQVISVSREEFEAVCDELADAGLPVRTDRDQAWEDFRGWRVNYDTVLLSLASMTMAPYANWISDRSSPVIASQSKQESN